MTSLSKTGTVEIHIGATSEACSSALLRNGDLVIALTPDGPIVEGVDTIYSGQKLGSLCLQYGHDPQDRQLLNIALVVRESFSIPGA